MSYTLTIGRSIFGKKNFEEEEASSGDEEEESSGDEEEKESGDEEEKESGDEETTIVASPPSAKSPPAS